MKIIAGTWRSRRLVVPDTSATRPMPDRVKKSLFDVLGSYYGCPGLLPPIRVLDAFAGGGALGLEALSRGVSLCWLVERNRLALAALRKNIASLQAGERATVLIGDGWNHARATPFGQSFDLIFLDPPYEDSHDPSADGAVRRCLNDLIPKADAGPVVVLHHEAKIRYELPSDEPWRMVDHRIIGSNGVTVFDR